MLTIRDLRGRQVRRFDLGPRDAGEYRFSTAPVWGGTDDDGRTVAPGMYFLTLIVDGKAIGSTMRLVFLPTNHPIVE